VRFRLKGNQRLIESGGASGNLPFAPVAPMRSDGINEMMMTDVILALMYESLSR